MSITRPFVLLAAAVPYAGLLGCSSADLGEAMSYDEVPQNVADSGTNGGDDSGLTGHDAGTTDAGTIGNDSGSLASQDGASADGAVDGGASGCDPGAWVYMVGDPHACEGHLGERCGWTTSDQAQGYHCQTASWGVGCEPGGETCGNAADAGLTDAGAPGSDGGMHDSSVSDSAISHDSGTASNYDSTILADSPVAYWAMTNVSATEPDISGNNHTGTYGGTPATATMPNGDRAASFDGATQYMVVPSSAEFSVPTTGSLTFEAWISPSVLQFPHDDGSSGYVDWMGKCEQYGPTCEWEARMYSTITNESPNRPNRISAYVFNPDAGLGSAADFQPAAGLIQAGHWYHIVGEYTTRTQPSTCQNTSTYPGSINIWVNGVPWNQAVHNPTGCMSQFSVKPKANGSALYVGTMARDSFFAGAIGKVALYDYLLTQTQIANHYSAMTGSSPTGSCASTCTF